MFKQWPPLIKANFVGFYLLFISLFFLSLNLIGATINVPPPPALIQPYIDGASSGDTIQLSAGVYVEQIEIISTNLSPKSIDLVGATSLSGDKLTTIQAPGPSTPLTEFFSYPVGMTLVKWYCIVLIDNRTSSPVIAQTVHIRDLIVDGDHQQDTTTLGPPPDNIYGSTARFFAIGYHEASGTLQNVHTTNTRQSINFNEVTGGGIVNASTIQPVTFSVTNSLVDFYQRIGIDMRGTTLTATISNNTVDRAYQPGPPYSQQPAGVNGIQFSGGAMGSITDNLVKNNIYNFLLNPPNQAVGILPTGAGANILVSGNTCTDNDIGIGAFSNGANLVIENNIINYTTTSGVSPAEGIVVADTNGLTTITGNIMNNIPDINMDLSATIGNENFALANNQFIGSQTGMLVSGKTGVPPASSVGPVITMDHDSFTGTIGYYIEESLAPFTAPKDIWPNDVTVSFDGLVSGHMTLAEFNFVLTKIFDKHNNNTLGLVLDFIPPVGPTLTSISPNLGPTSGGNTITITGDNFLSSNTQVFFGSTPGTNVVVVSNTEITVTVPPGAGLVDVTVTTPFGTSPIVPPGQYIYANSPTLSKIFIPDVVRRGDSSNMTITLNNPNGLVANITEFVDNLPDGLRVSGGAFSDCGGTLTATPGSTTITLTGGFIPANGSCSLTVRINVNSSRTATNILPAGALQTDLGNNVLPASADITTSRGGSCQGGRCRSGGGGAFPTNLLPIMPAVLPEPVIPPVVPIVPPVDGVINVEEAAGMKDLSSPESIEATELKSSGGCSSTGSNVSILPMLFAMMLFLKLRASRKPN